MVVKKIKLKKGFSVRQLDRIHVKLKALEVNEFNDIRFDLTRRNAVKLCTALAEQLGMMTVIREEDK